MIYNPKIHHRKSIRLKGYDYSKSGMYYITMTTQNWLCLFGHVKNGIMIFNDAGAMLESVWCDIPKYYTGFDVDEYVVMPNHFHGIIVINEDDSNELSFKGVATGDNPNEPVGVGPSANPNDRIDSNKGVGPSANPNDRIDSNKEVGSSANPNDRIDSNKRVGPSANPKGEPNPDDRINSNKGADAGIRPDEQVGDAQTEDQISTKLSLPDVIGRFKSMVMTHYSTGVKEKGWSPFYKKLWHRNYYDHIIRNEKDYERIVEYIRLNPENWERDKNNLKNLEVVREQIILSNKTSSNATVPGSRRPRRTA